MKKLSVLLLALAYLTPTFAHAEPHTLSDSAGAVGVGCLVVGLPVGALVSVVEADIKKTAAGAGLGCAVGMAVAGYGEYKNAQEAPTEAQLQESSGESEE